MDHHAIEVVLVLIIVIVISTARGIRSNPLTCKSKRLCTPILYDADAVRQLPLAGCKIDFHFAGAAVEAEFEAVALFVKQRQRFAGVWTFGAGARARSAGSGEIELVLQAIAARHHFAAQHIAPGLGDAGLGGGLNVLDAVTPVEFFRPAVEDVAEIRERPFPGTGPFRGRGLFGIRDVVLDNPFRARRTQLCARLCKLFKDIPA